MSFARATKAFPLEVPSTRDARESAPPGAVGAGGSSLVAGTSARGHVDKEEAVDDDETDEGAATTKSVDVRRLNERGQKVSTTAWFGARSSGATTCRA